MRSRRETFLLHLPHRLSTYQNAPRVPIVVRSGLVRHEMCLVDVNYCKETRPALPPTVLIHYFNPEVETEENLLSLSSPNPLCRIIYREAPTIISRSHVQADNIAESMQSGQMLEQLQMVPFTDAVPDCELSLPIADSTMESDDPVSSALDDDAYDWAAEAVPDAAMLANPLMETILGHNVSLTNESLFPEPLQWSDPSQPWSYPTPEPPLHVTAQPLGLSVTAPTLHTSGGQFDVPQRSGSRA